MSGEVSTTACDSACMGGGVERQSGLHVKARSWTSKVMVSVHVSHKETLMALKWGSDLTYINMNLEPARMHAARRGPGVEHCPQSAMLYNLSGPPPPPAL